jgi:hypothetical protein
VGGTHSEQHLVKNFKTLVAMGLVFSEKVECG